MGQCGPSSQENLAIANGAPNQPVVEAKNAARTHWHVFEGQSHGIRAEGGREDVIQRYQEALQDAQAQTTEAQVTQWSWHEGEYGVATTNDQSHAKGNPEGATS